MEHHFRIVYFSGTGGTKLAAELLAEELGKSGREVSLQILPPCTPVGSGSQTLILLFPVYAGGAPKPVYDWARALPRLDGTDAVVLSVSGGGEKPRLS